MSLLNWFESLIDSLIDCPFIEVMVGVLAVMWAFQLFHRLARNY